MQDKEFDELFKNRFESAEIEPSVNLWSNIEEQLAVKRKRVFPIYWSAAAAIAATLTVGVLFHKTEKIQLSSAAAITQQSEKDNGLTQKGNVLPTVTNSTDIVIDASKAAGNDQHVAMLQHNIEVAEGRDDLKLPMETTTDTGDEKKDLLAMQPSAVISHLDYKEAKVKQETVKLPKTIAAPVEELMLATADVSTDVVNDIDKDEAANESKRSESRGIRNMGDLINYVVDKVDKREEKFIQFKTDEDDNSSLIGLNIGMFKFSQKKHK